MFASLGVDAGLERFILDALVVFENDSTFAALIFVGWHDLILSGTQVKCKGGKGKPCPL